VPINKVLKAALENSFPPTHAFFCLPLHSCRPPLQKAVKLQEDGLLQAMHAAGNAIKGASKDALKAAREQMRAQVDNMFPA
jgi:hypothetical protein